MGGGGGGGSEKHKEEAEAESAGRTVRTLDTNKLCVCHSCRGSVLPHVNKAHRALWIPPRQPCNIEGASDVIGV